MEILTSNVWYHGSNLNIDILKEGSTITPWLELAEAFSHKPSILCIECDGSILHNGELTGYLYVIDEVIKIGKDIYPHPKTTMQANAEFLTNRPLKLKFVKEVQQLTKAQILNAQIKLDKLMEKYENRQ